jgi:hypothetical protein
MAFPVFFETATDLMTRLSEVKTVRVWILVLLQRLEVLGVDEATFSSLFRAEPSEQHIVRASVFRVAFETLTLEVLNDTLIFQYARA